ncbi:non-specific lipid transfer protein GPI-anchored 3 [Actinidia eriantha]|uniref:non-specific lipid transfer protein GPI-anchored 3 n=1 Tax=Actinidia eriantha TaxID=165200 RepID=UPI00258AF7D7|nr:non-specific lipid transfer protein GPI-anchored 3 [Actinidia eriantha]
MDLKMSVPLFLVIMCSWACLGNSEDVFGRGMGMDGGGDESSNSLPCLQKLMPCQPYLQSGGSGSGAPPASCCVPLKEMISGDTACLCGIFNNVDLLKTFNLTQDQALKLPKACSANADISVCKTDSAAPSGSPAIPTPATPSNSNTSPSNTTSPKSESAHLKNASIAGFSLIILFILNLIL